MAKAKLTLAAWILWSSLNLGEGVAPRWEAVSAHDTAEECLLARDISVEAALEVTRKLRAQIFNRTKGEFDFTWANGDGWAIYRCARDKTDRRLR